MKRLLSALFRPAPADSPPPGAVAEGCRVYAVGDVHGRLDLLNALADAIRDDLAGWSGTARLILLGDLVDRGPDSAGVLARLAGGSLAGLSPECIAGNHEEAMLRALDGDLAALRFWQRAGGRETLSSYGVDAATLDGGDDELLLAAAQAAVPATHRALLAAAADTIEVGDYLFVHAGVRPGVSLTAQSASDLRWIREPFLSDTRPHGRVIVHGHTVVPEPEDRPNRIALDTGAYATGRLTALVLEGATRRFLFVQEPA